MSATAYERLGEYARRLGRAEDEIARLERENLNLHYLVSVKDDALTIAEGLLQESDSMLQRYAAATALAPILRRVSA